MAAEQHDLQPLVTALTEALRRSGWYDRASLQDALYGWAACGLSVGEVRAWLAANIANPTVALDFRDLGIGPDEVRIAGVGEQVSVGRLSVDDAARAILGPRAVGDLSLLRAAPRAERFAAADRPAGLRAGQEWWHPRIQRLGNFLDGKPTPAEPAAWVRDQSDEELLGYRDLAAEWAGPLTIAVAHQELDRLGGPLEPGGPDASGPLWSLIFGALSVRELTRRLGGRVEAAITAPPAYLTVMLGPYPAAEPAQLIWTQAALAIETFRLECSITDPRHTLGDPDARLPLSERLRFEQLNRALPRIRVELKLAGLEGRRHRRGAWLSGPADATGDGAADGRQATADPRQAIAALLHPDAKRPDQEFAKHVGEWICQQPAVRQRTVRPPVAMAVDFSDEELAVWWATLPEWQRRRTVNLSDEVLAGRWAQAVERHLQDATQDPVCNHQRRPLAEAATLLSEIDRRVTTRMRTVIANPPVYITRALGPRPAAGDNAADDYFGATSRWDRLAAETEEYRLLTGAADATRALGPTPTPVNSWQQCWRRELAGEVADAYYVRMRYQHQVIGTAEDRNQLAVLVTSMADPWFGVRPNAAMVEESGTLATGQLRHRVATAVPLLADRPANPSSHLRDAQLRHARLVAYRDHEQAALAAAQDTCDELRWVAGRGARAARNDAAAAVRRHHQALADIDQRLAGARQDLAGLEQAQAAYLDWCGAHALQVAQGQAAAEALQVRESSLLEELGAYPPTYLLVELGQPPTNPDGRAAWLRGALAIERYRATYRVCDRDQACGAWRPTGSTLTIARRMRDQEQTCALLDDVRRAITDSLAREVDGLSLPAPHDGLGD